MDDTRKAGRIFSMAEIPFQTFERSGILEEGNIDFGTSASSMTDVI
jgi:hypothetical protein